MRHQPTRCPRRTVLLTIAAPAALLLAPTVALAVDGVPDAPATSQRAEDAASAATQAVLCEVELTTFSREGVSGAAQAVAMTAQSMDRDTDGWLHIAWQAADGTHLTDVLATDPDGTTRQLDPTPTGTVEHVTTITFCGTHTTPDPAGPGDAAAPGDAAVAAAPATPAVPTAVPTADTTVSVAAQAPAPDGEHGEQNGNDGNRDDRLPTTHDGDDGEDGDDGDDGEDGDDGDIEVLGVRLVNPVATTGVSADRGLGQIGGTAGEESRTLALAGTERPVAGLHPWLLIAAIGAGLAAAGSLLRARTQPVTATQATTTPDGPEAGR